MNYEVIFSSAGSVPPHLFSCKFISFLTEWGSYSHLDQSAVTWITFSLSYNHFCEWDLNPWQQNTELCVTDYYITALVLTFLSVCRRESLKRK